MTLLLTTGFEVAVTTAAAVSPDNPTTTAAPTGCTRDTASQRTGTGCLKADAGAGGTATSVRLVLALSVSTTYYSRGYFRFGQLPTTATQVMGDVGTSFVFGARVTPGGKLQMIVSNAQSGSDSAVTMTTGVYYRIELMVVVNGSTQMTATEVRLDGVTVASASGLSASVSKSVLSVGWLGAAPGANSVVFVDDITVNNGAGSVNNSWPGAGAVAMLLPTADSAEGAGWTRGNGTAFSGNNGWDSVNNAPPVGIADLGGAGADTGQIRNAASNANSAFDATMTTYAAAGVTGTVNAITPWTATAAPVATSAKLGDVGVVSNPTITNINLAAGGTSGAFWSGTIAGTYPTGWKWSPGTITEAPSVTLGTAPVMRVNQQTASTRIAMVCFMGMYVDYTPAAAAAAIPDTAMALTVT